MSRIEGEELKNCTCGELQDDFSYKYTKDCPYCEGTGEMWIEYANGE